MSHPAWIVQTHPPFNAETVCLHCITSIRSVKHREIRNTPCACYYRVVRSVLLLWGMCWPTLLWLLVLPGISESLPAVEMSQSRLKLTLLILWQLIINMIPGVVPNSDPCQIITPLVLVGLGLGVREGLGLGNQIAISTRGVIIWQGVENGHNTGIPWPLKVLHK